MKQPQFTFWPWKILSVCVPVMALVGAVLFRRDHSANMPFARYYYGVEVESIAVFFSLLGAGNGYMMAVATGDLGRSVLSIPFGAISGYGIVLVLAFWPANLLYIGLLALLVFSMLVADAESAHGGCAGCLIMLMLGLAGLLLMLGNSSEKLLCLFSAYPLLCACTTGCMPLEWKPGSIFAAALAGTRAALYGVLAGSIVGLIVAALSSFVLAAFFSGPSIPDEILPACFVGLCLATANVICMMNIFATTYRAERAAEIKPVPVGKPLETSPVNSAPLTAPENKTLPDPNTPDPKT